MNLKTIGMTSSVNTINNMYVKYWVLEKNCSGIFGQVKLGQVETIGEKPFRIKMNKEEQ